MARSKRVEALKAGPMRVYDIIERKKVGTFIKLDLKDKTQLI